MRAISIGLVLVCCASSPALARSCPRDVEDVRRTLSGKAFSVDDGVTAYALPGVSLLGEKAPYAIVHRFRNGTIFNVEYRLGSHRSSGDRVLPPSLVNAFTSIHSNETPPFVLSKAQCAEGWCKSGLRLEAKVGQLNRAGLHYLYPAEDLDDMGLQKSDIPQAQQDAKDDPDIESLFLTCSYAHSWSKSPTWP